MKTQYKATMKVDILVKPEDKCDHIEQVIRLASKATNVPVEIQRTSNFALYSHCAINPSQTPVVIIKGNVEFAGKALDLEAVKRRLTELAYR